MYWLNIISFRGNGCDTSRNVLVAVTVDAISFGWGFLSKNTDSAQDQLCRASMPGKDSYLLDAVRKIQALYEMRFSVLFRGMLGISEIKLDLMTFPVSLPSLI